MTRPSQILNIYLIKFQQIVLLLLFPLFSGFSCTNKSGTAKQTVGKGNPDDIVSIAKRFRLQVTDSCTIAFIINPWQGATAIQQEYYLVRRADSLLYKTDLAKTIYVPVRKIISMSTTHLAIIKALGETNSVTGVSGAEYIYDSVLTERIRSGLISDVGYESGINTEVILKKAPDLVMMYGVGSESAGYTGKIEELGIKVIFNADYLETHPLGKAEWIKLFGALYCKEEMADSIFNSVSESYMRVRSMVRQASSGRPEVLLGLPFKDTWFISPGNSYVSILVADAGGHYLWEDSESSVSMPLGLEDVYLKAVKADYWLNTGSVTTRKEIISLDPRLGLIPCFIQGNLYNNNKRLSAGGGNDYWESGIICPHLLLMDIASVLHPGIFPEHELIYYRRLD
jgi:iron complex transport system substrate-binding protein